MVQTFQQDCLQILDAKRRDGTIDRRGFITALAMLGAAPAILRGGAARAAEGEFIVANWGGDAIDAFQSAFGDGFAEASGLTVRTEGAAPTRGAMQAQAESGAILWDVADSDGATPIQLAQDGLVEPMDYSIIDKEKLEPGAAFEHTVPPYYYSYVLTYDARRFGDDAPKTWADFWDVEKYPGKRTMTKWLGAAMEAALLADGVAPQDLYPLDMDRAMRKLEEIKPHVTSFWSSGAESQQLMRDGEATMGMLWHTRASLVERDTEGDVSWTFENGLMTPSGWAVLKGNPAGARAAMEYIAFAQDPERQVELLRLMSNGPANPAAHALVPDELKRFDCSSPENLARQVIMDMQWYADNGDEAFERFLAYTAS